ncbi:hypothetical protein K0T92_15150 [Paenibacillus oenotherae]|uniref:Uncharacterized protein n=1 Tax=Paenibacillus oenotherae TaxID=1435645 RepID=A0ABS7D976_9BACL|nr:hypothetical protein [Paenibacillus oenotherae]MBW7476082.1 hypothetical protein [Paenibacillus oenotherae]
MSEVLYDCSQFISFDTDENTDMSYILTVFEEKNNYRVLPEDKIQSKKVSHLNGLLHSITFEILNQEFIGEFDEWFELEEIPSAIVEFGCNVQEFCRNKHVKNLTIILVRYAYSEKDDDIVFVGEFHRDNIFEGLYHASVFGNSGNIVALKLFNSN